mgnify:FL=1
MEPEQNEVIIEEVEEGQLVFGSGRDDPVETAAALFLLIAVIAVMIPLAILTAAVVGLVTFSEVLSL